jgi:hypothetical protein
MISRTLVPVDVRPVSKDEARKIGHRRETYMDERTVVPSGTTDAPPLDGKSSIPAHLPLGVLVDRTLVPRSLPANRIESFRPLSEYAPIAVLDSRVVVPAYVEPAEPEEIQEFVEHAPERMSEARREVVQPDIFTTGDPNLLIEPEEKIDAKKDLLTRTGSVLVHIGLILFIISIPKIFPPHVPTRDEIELASRSLGRVYIPPDEIPKMPGPPPGPKMHIAPKVLNEVAPPRPESHAPIAPPVAPEKPRVELPSAPTPHVPTSQVPVPTAGDPAPSHVMPVQPPSNPTPGKLNLGLGNSSPGKALQDQMAGAIQNGGGGVHYGSPGGGGGGGGGRGGMQRMQPGVSILTPTEGVDFNSYINRLLATVKRNWYAVMPESAIMGDKGIVVITFHINRDGTVPMPDPNLERTSGKEPLDVAALSSIRTSSPFEPLPPQFKGPFIELRFIFFYNLPIDYGQ